MADSKLNELSLITTPTMNSPLYTVESNSDKRMLIKDISQVIGDENIAPAYDATETYSEGDLRMREGKLYQANQDIDTPEQFDATKWDEIKVTELSSGGGPSVVQLTQAEYDLLDPAVQANGSIYKITDNAKMYCLNKAYHPVEECTVAEYNQKTSAQQNDGTIYIQTDKETTGSDIAVSDTDATSIAEAIGDINSITRLFDYKTIDAGTSAVFNPAPTTYTGATFFGFVSGIGYVALVASTGTNNNITVRDITTGTAFSSQYLTFAWNTSTHEITVTASAGARLFAILDKF